MALMAVALFIGLSSEGYDRLWVAHLMKDFSFPDWGGLSAESWLGIMRLGSRLLGLAATEMLRRRQKAESAWRLTSELQGLSAFMVIGLLILTLTRQFLVAVLAYWLIEVMRRTAGPLFEGLLNKHTRSEVRATVPSLNAQVDALGQIVGGPIVGAVGTHLSLRHALSLVSFILMPVIPLYGRAQHRQHGQDTLAET